VKMSSKMKKVIFVSRPTGEPTEDNFKVVEDESPKITGDRQILTKTLYLSVDPYMRGRMDEKESYAPPWKLNELPCGGGIGRVIESSSPDFQKGDLVYTMSYPWQTYALFNQTEVKDLTKLEQLAAW